MQNRPAKKKRRRATFEGLSRVHGFGSCLRAQSRVRRSSSACRFGVIIFEAGIAAGFKVARMNVDLFFTAELTSSTADTY